jgi:catechol 2,3-dioxygenase-like lactoylglutathione lyase family enzyme
MRSELPPAVPEIPVTDVATAVAYYTNQLGFSLDWRDDDLGLAGISERTLPDIPGEPAVSTGTR